MSAIRALSSSMRIALHRTSMHLALILLTLSTISLLQYAIDRPDTLVGPTDRPSRPCLRRPSIDVEVNPSPGVADKALQEQGRRDRAGKPTGARIVHRGDLGRDHRIVRRPERHLPERIIAREPSLHQ